MNNGNNEEASADISGNDEEIARRHLGELRAGRQGRVAIERAGNTLPKYGLDLAGLLTQSLRSTKCSCLSPKVPRAGPGSHAGSAKQ